MSKYVIKREKNNGKICWLAYRKIWRFVWPVPIFSSYNEESQHDCEMALRRYLTDHKTYVVKENVI